MSRLDGPARILEPPVIEEHTSPRFEHIWQILGMSKQAPYGWSKIHVKPHIACIAYFASLAPILTITSILYGCGVPWLTPIMHGPFIVNSAILACNNYRLWRHGPDVAAAFTYRMTKWPESTIGLFLLTASFTGPDRYIPFSDLIITVLATSVLTFCACCASALGASIWDRPAEPYMSLWPVIINSAFTSMRFMDVCTDMGVVRLLLTQGPECVWYGKAVPCSFFTRLAILVAVMGAANMILMLAVVQLGGQAALFGGSSKQLRAAIGGNAVIMLLQIGTITVTLLHVFSDIRHPASAAADVARLRREAAFGLISACSTVAAFCVGAVGMRRLTLLLQAAARSARGRGRGSRASAAGHAVCPVDGAEAGCEAGQQP